MSDERRDVLEGLEGYTVGPWRFVPVSHKFSGGIMTCAPQGAGFGEGTLNRRHRKICDNPYTDKDARLIARAPDLVKEIRKLREALRHMVEGAEAVEDWGDILPDAVPRARVLLPDTPEDR
jgi:hypothetical protein